MWKKPNIKTTLHILRTTPICAYKIQDKFDPISAVAGGSNVETDYDRFMVSNSSSSRVACYEKEEAPKHEVGIKDIFGICNWGSR